MIFYNHCIVYYVIRLLINGFPVFSSFIHYFLLWFRVLKLFSICQLSSTR